MYPAIMYSNVSVAACAPLPLQGRWSKEETAKLQELVAQLPGRWTEIGLKLGRLPEGVRDKVSFTLFIPTSLNTFSQVIFPQLISEDSIDISLQQPCIATVVGQINSEVCLPGSFVSTFGVTTHKRPRQDDTPIALVCCRLFTTL